VKLQQLAHIKLRLLEHLHFADKHIMEGIDWRTSLLNILAEALQDELAHQILKLTAALALNDFSHLLADGADLRGLSI